MVLGHYLAARTDPRAVLLPVPDHRSLQPQDRRLGITASFSRPRVSDDNAYAYVEALFRTLKYSPGFPRHGFAALAAARDWVHAFADWYNTVHRHRGIQYVTPPQRHSGEDVAILRQRHEVYDAARRQHPTRWSGDTRNWGHIREVWLNN